MANFFNDNPDLIFQFDRLDLKDAVQVLEENYTQAEKYPEAPQNYEEAMEFYRGALELAGDIAANVAAPQAMEVDQQGALFKDGKVQLASGTKEALKQLAEADLMGVPIPRKYGGMNLPATIYIMMIELISRADASLMTLFGYQDVGEAISKFGTEEVGNAFLLKYTRGEHTGAMVLSEPSAGSDLQAVKLQAFQDEQGQWRLRGMKHFISNGCGDILLVLARSEPNTTNMFGLSLFVCRGDETVQINRIEEKMGLHGSPTCELYFNNTAAELVGKRRFGLMHVLYTLNHARFSVAAQAIGIAEAAYREALSYAKEREQFGKIIYTMSPVADMLINMRVVLESSRSFLYSATQWLDLRNKLEEHIDELKAEGKPFADEKKRFDEAAKVIDMLSPMVKYMVTEACIRVCYDALQIHGGMGYMREMAVERLNRDVRITTIYEGTTQVQVAGAAKGAYADVLAHYFDAKEAKNYPSELKKLSAYLKEIRTIFSNCNELIQSHEDTHVREVAARDISDMYGSMYVGYLLLDEAEGNGRKAKIARRYITNALAQAHKSLASVKYDHYIDIKQIDEICD